MQGSDAKDALLGRIFGYSAFSQAGRGASHAVADRLTASLIAAMGRKSFLREAAATALVACLLGLPPQALKHVLSSSEPLRDMLTRKPDETSPEVMAGHLCLPKKLNVNVVHALYRQELICAAKRCIQLCYCTRSTAAA